MVTTFYSFYFLSEFVSKGSEAVPAVLELLFFLGDQLLYCILIVEFVRLPESDLGDGLAPFTEPLFLCSEEVDVFYFIAWFDVFLATDFLTRWASVGVCFNHYHLLGSHLSPLENLLLSNLSGERRLRWFQW